MAASIRANQGDRKEIRVKKEAESTKRDTTDALLSVKAAAAQLGLNDKTLRNWCTLRSIDFVKIPPNGPRSALRIRQSTIDEMIEKGSVEALGKKPRAARAEKVKQQA